MHPRTFHPLTIRPEVIVTVGSWRGGTRILSKARSVGKPKVLVHKVKKDFSQIAIIGEGMPQHLFLRKVLDVLEGNSVKPLGVFAYHSRPSITLIVGRDDLTSALSALHDELIVGGI
jgi:aspartokinase